LDPQCNFTETAEKEPVNSLLYNAKLQHIYPFLSCIPVFHFSCHNCRLCSVVANKDRAYYGKTYFQIIRASFSAIR